MARIVCRSRRLKFGQFCFFNIYISTDFLIFSLSAFYDQKLVVHFWLVSWLKIIIIHVIKHISNANYHPNPNCSSNAKLSRILLPTDVSYHLYFHVKWKLNLIILNEKLYPRIRLHKMSRSKSKKTNTRLLPLTE